MTPDHEQLLLLPHRVFREVELAPPASIRRLCVRTTAAPRRAAARPTRWIPGTAPVVHLPMAGTRRTRRYRAGHKPGSIGAGKLSRAERSAFRLLEWELLHEGHRFGPPKTFAECQNEVGPCPHVSCSANLYLDVLPPRSAGSDPVIKINYVDEDGRAMEIDKVGENCALRLANAGGVTLEEVGRRLNLTMGRADQIEKRAVRKCADVADAEGWGEDWRGILART